MQTPKTAPLILASTLNWNGSLGSSWLLATNWNELAVPANGNALIFPAAATSLAMTNDITLGSAFDSLTFQRNGYTLSGNAFSVTNGITGIGSNTINAAITLNASQQFNFGGSLGALNVGSNALSLLPNGSTLTIGGPISGNGQLRADGSGQITTFSGTSTFSGNTTIATGAILQVNGSIPSPITANGRLAGTGS